MKSDYCHIHMVLDRSGSMETIREDVIGGFNSFIEEQKKVPGEATVSLVQFDTEDPYEVIYDFERLYNVKNLTRETFVPRGATPLLDAMGRGINDCEAHLAKLSDWDRPKKVLFCIITDGQENRSKEFKKPEVMQMIEARKQEGWEFIFMSCDQNAIQDAVRDYGINANNTMSFTKSAKGTRDGYTRLSCTVSSYRRS